MRDWAGRADAYIVEDDYDGAFAFDTARFTAIKAMETANRIIHAGSFIQNLCSILRVGGSVLPRVLHPRLRAVRAEMGRGHSPLEQHVLSHVMADGDFAQHNCRMGRVYFSKSITAQRVIQHAYGPLSVLGTQGGFHFALGLSNSWTGHAFRRPAKLTA